MSLTIHPTASVHSSAILQGDVEVGAGTTIGPFCVIQGPAVIGTGNRIYPHCIIGTEGEHKTATPAGLMVIGDNNVLREMLVMQRGTGDRDTRIGDGCYIMAHCHVGHDALVSNGVTVAPNASLGGHMVVLEGATLGMGSSIHQFSTVGAYAMVGMEAAVVEDVPPLCLVRGNPARFGQLNTRACSQLGISDADVEVVDGASGASSVRYKTDKVLGFLSDFDSFTKRKAVVTPTSS